MPGITLVHMPCSRGKHSVLPISILTWSTALRVSAVEPVSSPTRRGGSRLLYGVIGIEVMPLPLRAGLTSSMAARTRCYPNCHSTRVKQCPGDYNMVLGNMLMSTLLGQVTLGPWLTQLHGGSEA